MPLGASFMLLLTPQSQPFVAAIGTFLMGFGMGLLSITTVALVQDSVEWSMRGSATASILFARSLGTTIGATAVGALLNIGIAHYGSGTLAASVRKLLNQPDGLAQLSNYTTARSVFDRGASLELLRDSATIGSHLRRRLAHSGQKPSDARDAERGQCLASDVALTSRCQITFGTTKNSKGQLM